MPQFGSSDWAIHIAGLEFFQGLDTAVLNELIVGLRQIQLAAGESLFHQGDVGDSMYVLIEGRLAVAIKDTDGTRHIIDELGPGVSVGEMALLTGQTRAATVYATEPSALLQLSRAGFEQLAAQNPTAIMQFAQAILPRLQRTQLVGVLAAIFGNLSKEALHELQAKLEWQHLSTGEILFHQGDLSHALYIVVNGRLRIAAAASENNQRIIDEVSRGGTVGELEVLTGEPRSATAYAIRDTNVVRLPKSSFEHLLERYPQAMMRIARHVIARLQPKIDSPAPTTRSIATFAVIPISDNVPLRDFAGRLVDALGALGSTLHLNSVRLDSAVGREGIAQLPADHPASVTLVSWLSEQETKYQYIVYEAETSWSEWTSRCLRQADHILLVGSADADPEPGAIEMEMRRRRMQARHELVLLQPPARERPAGTERWLKHRPVEEHYHVRLHRNVDISRLARRLTGHALGLVLGGGAARGYAHIGVIQALEEAGIHPDLVGGTSMGAGMAAFYALGTDPHAIMEYSRKFGGPRELFDYTLPLVSFLASKKLTNLLMALFEDIRIEDLWIPFFCVSSNLSQAKPVVHREGLLWEAVRASISIPGVFTPVRVNDDLLVDGGLMNNMPIDIMRAIMKGGRVIGSSVTPERDMLKSHMLGSSLSGWQVLWSRLNPFAQPLQVPSILETLSRSRELNDAYQVQLKRSMTDLFITSPVAQFPGMDFSQGKQIAEVGYQAAREAIARWQDTAAAVAGSPPQ